MGPVERNSFTHTNTFQEGILHLCCPQLSLFDPNSRTRKWMSPNCYYSWPNASGHLLYFSMKGAGGKISELVCPFENLNSFKCFWQIVYHWICNTKFTAVVLNSSPWNPPPCTFCISLFSDTLSSVHRVYSNELRIWIRCVKGLVHFSKNFCW